MAAANDQPDKQAEVQITIKRPQKTTVQQKKESRQIPKRSIKSLNSPSIKDALLGKSKEDAVSAKEQHQLYANSNNVEEFTETELEKIWKSFVSKLIDRPSLQTTLSHIPEIKDGFELHLEIENRVQEDSINLIKPELVSYLRRELRNSKISLITKITEKTHGRVIYTDEEKYSEMLKKNPNLAVLKKKFNLDFGD